MFSLEKVIELLSVMRPNQGNLPCDDNDGISRAQHDLEIGPVDKLFITAEEYMPVG